jgi:hypothetical protein
MKKVTKQDIIDKEAELQKLMEKYVSQENEPEPTNDNLVKARQRIIDALREREGEPVDWSNREQPKYIAQCIHDTLTGSDCSLLSAVDPWTQTQLLGGIYTTSRDAANWVIKNMADDLKTVLGVKP